MSWIQTYTGRVIGVQDSEHDICIEDITHALSNICRFTGHSRKFYSVAEHSVLTMQALRDEVGIDRPEVLKWALLHDATEAYLCDIAKPFKHLMGPDYKDFDNRLERSIRSRFGVPYDGNVDAIVKVADTRMLATERQQIMSICRVEWDSLDGYEPFESIFISHYPPPAAKRVFMAQFERLFQDAPVHISY